MSDAAARPSRWWWAGLLGLTILAVGLHVAAGYIFPRPWPDESHFLAPALRLADAGTLRVPELNAPDGIFWMPSGYYVLLAPVLALGVDPLTAGRAVSLAGVTVFAAALASIARAAGLSRVTSVLIAAAWLSTPRVVAAGNIARMESVVLAVAGVSLWLVSRERWAAAVAVAAFAPLVHPVGFVVLAAVSAAWWMRADRPVWAPWEIGLVLAAATGWVVQLGYFAAHLDLARTHLGFQLTRKSARQLGVGVWAPLALAGTALSTWLATRWWRGASGPWVAMWTAGVLAAGFVVAEVGGREIWYGVLGRETAVALVAVTLLAGLARPARRRSARWHQAVAGVALVALGGALVWTLGPGWFRSAPDVTAGAEWRGFVAGAVAQLGAVDAQQQQSATVYVDPLSGFGQEVFARSWTSLTFVQPTPATPQAAATADFVLVTPGVPLRTPGLSQTWGEQEPVVLLRSSGRRFRLELYANPSAAGSS